MTIFIILTIACIACLGFSLELIVDGHVKEGIALGLAGIFVLAVGLHSMMDKETGGDS